MSVTVISELNKCISFSKNTTKHTTKNCTDVVNRCDYKVGDVYNITNN